MVCTDTPSYPTPILQLHSSVHSGGEQSHVSLCVGEGLDALCSAVGYIAAALSFKEHSQQGGDVELDTGSCDPVLAARALLCLLEEVPSISNEPPSPAPHCHPILLTPSSATPTGALSALKRAALCNQGSSGPGTPTASTSPASVFQSSRPFTEEPEPSTAGSAPDHVGASGSEALLPEETQLQGQGASCPAPLPASAPEGPSTHRGPPPEEPPAVPAIQEGHQEAAEAARPAAAPATEQVTRATVEEVADVCLMQRAPPVLRAKATGQGQLDVTPANVASLLCLADQWDVPRLRGRVLRELRHSPLFCGGLKPYAVGTPAVENVPQVLLLLEQAIPFVGDTDGGLKSLQADCFMWLAENAVRTWPTRAFASLPSAIQKRVLQQAISNLKVHGALGALLRCQHLQAAVPQGLTWATGVADLAEELREATLTFIWANFVAVVCSPSLRKDLAEPWSTEVLVEVSAFAKVQGSPADAIKALVGWPQVQRKMGTWEELPHLQEAVSAFYADLRAHASKHFGAVSSSVAFKALPARQQQQLMADLQVMHLTSKPLDARGPIRPSTSSANQARGSAECGHGEQGGQIGGGGAGSHKGGTMFIIAGTSSPARQRREAAAAAASASTSPPPAFATGNIPKRPHKTAPTATSSSSSSGSAAHSQPHQPHHQRHASPASGSASVGPLPALEHRPDTQALASASASNLTPKSGLPPPPSSVPCASEAGASRSAQNRAAATAPAACSASSTASPHAVTSPSSPSPLQPPAAPASASPSSSAGPTAGFTRRVPPAAAAAAAAASRPHMAASSLHSKPASTSRIPQTSNKLPKSTSTAAWASSQKHDPSKQSQPRHPSTTSGIPHPHKHTTSVSSLPSPHPGAPRNMHAAAGTITAGAASTALAAPERSPSAAPPAPAAGSNIRPASARAAASAAISRIPCSAGSAAAGSRRPASASASAPGPSGALLSPLPLARRINGARCSVGTAGSSNGANGPSRSCNGNSGAHSASRSSRNSSSRRRDEPSRMIPDSKNSYLGSLRACKAAALGLADSGSAGARGSSAGPSCVRGSSSLAQSCDTSHLATACTTKAPTHPDSAHNCITVLADNGCQAAATAAADEGAEPAAATTTAAADAEPQLHLQMQAAATAAAAAEQQQHEAAVLPPGSKATEAEGLSLSPLQKALPLLQIQLQGRESHSACRPMPWGGTDVSFRQERQREQRIVVSLHRTDGAHERELRTG
eukprot:CAMPEP_0202338388 /NCGR_PEP_ID=MMETSP1126-20121109/681_1 /ASSEMBLY_ACC=CAM_ASM_000457 /TAXON_ID=3047 /ORGANISM="Dunaliella tertiolecta, Strain CCMP1320" /LENGTH=1225 /DNA_ID=CAMNT_0048928751 /DNA_START=184 /DNA_END=3862 /DNA_ORIENTATION=-